MDWLVWFFSPLAAIVLPSLLSLVWFAFPIWREGLRPQIRAWVNFVLLATSSISFLSWLLSPLEVLLRGGTHMLEWFLRLELAHLWWQDAWEYRFLMLPFWIQSLLMVCAFVLTLLEQMWTLFHVRRLKTTHSEQVVIIESSALMAFTYGWWRPRVFVSRAVWDSPMRQSVLAHEQAHQKRFDPLRLGLARFFYRLSLLNPFAVWLWQQHQLAIEQACDYTAAQTVGTKRYAGVLLDYAQQKQTLLPAVMGFSSQTLLENRLMALVRPKPFTRWKLLLSGVLVSALLGLSIWQRTHMVVVPNAAQFVKSFKPVMRLGMQFVFRQDDRTFVVSIYPNSLADQAGFRVGDEVLTICGQSPIEVFATPWRRCEMAVQRGQERLVLVFDRSELMPKP
jgi:Zn-dependent protease with chaperone function